MTLGLSSPVTLTLPWPDSRLLPNRKLHWGTKHRVAEDAKQTAWAIGMEWRNRNGYPDPMGLCGATVTFYPPDKRRRDIQDNYAVALKPYWDGLVRAGILKDDSCIREISVTMGAPDKANARVEITLREA